MGTTQKPLFLINGFLDTKNSCWDNIDRISSAASAWTTYDTTTGKWSLVINREETPVKTFDDSNIVGNITLTKSPLSSAYTGGKFKYSNRDIPGSFDSIEYKFDEVNTGNFVDYDYRATDLDNTVEITNELVNEYVQADVLLNRELKQSRRRTNIEFFTDFGALDLLAGDVVNVTSDLFYDDQVAANETRKFRVIEIEETDGDGGEILLKIIGVEYSDEDYDLFGFERFNVETADPMPPIKSNTTVQNNIAEGDGVKVGNALATDAGRAAITGAGVPLFASTGIEWTTADVNDTFAGGSTGNTADYSAYATGTPNVYTNSLSSYFLSRPALGGVWQTNSSCKLMSLKFEGPQGLVNYTTGGSSRSIAAGIPCQLDLFYATSPTGNWTLSARRFMEWSSYLSGFEILDIPVPLNWLMLITPLNTYDLDQSTSNVIAVDSVSNIFTSPGSTGAAYLSVQLFLN